MTSSMPTPIGPEQAELIGRRVSIIVGGRDAAHRAHLMRAVGCRLSEDRRRVTVFLAASAARQLLDDLRANGLIATVFCEPTSNRALQLKGSDATVAPIEAGDAQFAQAYLRRFAEEIGELGFAANVAHTALGHVPSDLVAVHFTPETAFEQTPGPKAGEALGGPGGVSAR